ncbi:MAG: hypothetical protein ACFFC7_16135 [Candidatus Hermodarchaeota archaeon]
MKIKEELQQLGYNLIKLSAADKKQDPLLENFKYKTLPQGAGSHNYFKSLDAVKGYVKRVKEIRRLEIPV